MECMRVLIARSKNKREASFAARLIRQYKRTSTVITGESLEDLYLGEMINEGLKETMDIPLKNFKKYLNGRIKALRR